MSAGEIIQTASTAEKLAWLAPAGQLYLGLQNCGLHRDPAHDPFAIFQAQIQNIRTKLPELNGAADETAKAGQKAAGLLASIGSDNPNCQTALAAAGQMDFAGRAELTFLGGMERRLREMEDTLGVLAVQLTTYQEQHTMGLNAAHDAVVQRQTVRDRTTDYINGMGGAA
ncbi:MAG TPA: hypothetical protein VMR45_01650 [Patescibacteria group bacterium]|nr:hypothetical protein [Patescibacteria group bacterium]